MCRFLAYSGAPVFLDQMLVAPTASLITQSLTARQAKTIVNADGCGIGWYGDRDEPGVYHGVLPAWSDHNLASLCRQLRSRMFVAHIRSATSGEVAFANCHPFAYGAHLFMHNGQIGDYEVIRRRVDALIPDTLYARRRGSSDTEAIFLAAIGHGLADDPVGAITQTLRDIRRIMCAAGIDKPLRFTAIHADGQLLRCYRWASDNRPPSLYWRHESTGQIIASEPFDEDPGWTVVPPGHMLTLGSDIPPILQALAIDGPEPALAGATLSDTAA